MTRYFQGCCLALNNRTKAFTLIETAIVLAVVSIAVASALSFYGGQIKKEHIETTKERMYDIKGAMARYQAIHAGHLPCPAPVDAAPGSAEFGKSNTVNCSTDPVQSGTTRVNGTGGEKVRIGAVPVLDLGLPADRMSDRWGTRFVYAVSEKLADTTIPYDENNGAITLMGDGGTVLGPAPNKTPFVLLSPGESRAGGTTYEGKPSPVPCPASGPEKDNCDNADGTFRAATFSTASDTADRFNNLVLNTLPSDDKLSVCGDKGMIYGATHPMKGGDGCVPSLIQDPSSGNVGIGGPPLSSAHLDVRGEIKLGNTALACGPGTAGAMRYNATALVPEICNGTVWKTLIGDPGSKGDKGIVGPGGPKGDPGPQGPKGDPGAGALFCGDGACNNGEACGTCPGDCGACPVGGPVCGDGACNGGEACGSCPADCGACGPGASCNLPWGGSIGDGAQATAYAPPASVVHDGAGAYVCASEERHCSNGALDGSYTSGSCPVCGNGTCEAGEFGGCCEDCNDGTCSCGDGTCNNLPGPFAEKPGVCAADCGGGAPTPFTVGVSTSVGSFSVQTFDLSTNIPGVPSNVILTDYQADNYGQLWINGNLVYQNGDPGVGVNVPGISDMRNGFLSDCVAGGASCNGPDDAGACGDGAGCWSWTGSNASGLLCCSANSYCYDPYSGGDPSPGGGPGGDQTCTFHGNTTASFYDDGCPAGCKMVHPSLDITGYLLPNQHNTITFVCANAKDIGDCVLSASGEYQ